MRVLITASTFPLAADDVRPRFVLDLAQALTARCEQVSALAPHGPGAATSEVMGDVEVQRFPYFWPRSKQQLVYGNGNMRENMRGSLLAKLQVPLFMVRQWSAVASLVRSRKIQVVNSHWLVPQGLSAALARGRSPRFRHVLSVHAGDVYLLHRVPLGSAIARFVCDRTDFIFADGSHVRDSLDALLGRPSNARLQPMGVDGDHFRPSASSAAEPIETRFRDGYLLFFGRFSEKKGVIYLLRALPKILERYPGLGLVLVGFGQLEDELRAAVSELELGDAVDFVGRQPHVEIGRYLRGCRLAIVPSIIDQYGETEGMPTVVVEAMSAGTRVVGSAVDGIPDVIRHGENGWLCREKDPADLAEKILDALAEPDASRVVEQALATAEDFAWSKVGGRYATVFEEILARPS